MSLDLRPVPLGPAISSRLAHVRGLTRLAFEKAILRAVAAEERRFQARQRAEASRHRRLFGWCW
jgi:hypothetical protein